MVYASGGGVNAKDASNDIYRQDAKDGTHQVNGDVNVLPSPPVCAFDVLGGLGVLSATGGEKKIDPPQFINPGMVLKFALSLSSRCLPDQV